MSMSGSEGASFSVEFIGVGAARAGTTWLSRALRAQPDVFMPEEKELHYFETESRYRTDLKGYVDKFRGAPKGAVKGEFTPRYMISVAALARIRRHFPNVKILVVLRDPVERAYSQWRYFHANKKNEPEGSFERALEGRFHVDYVVKSLYCAHLQAMRTFFADEQIVIHLYDDIRERPAGVVRHTCEVLGVPFSVPSNGAWAKPVNESLSVASSPTLWCRGVRAVSHGEGVLPALARRCVGPMIPALNRFVDRLSGLSAVIPGSPPADVRHAVYSRYFRQDVERLEGLLARDLSCWKPR